MTPPPTRRSAIAPPAPAAVAVTNPPPPAPPAGGPRGATRMTTWIRPADAHLTYLANFSRHVDRLRQVALILGDHGIRLGLEYVGPKTAWASKRYPFVHTLAETRELIEAIGRTNVGVV